MDGGSLGLLLKMLRLVGLAPFKQAPDFQVSHKYVIIGRIFMVSNAFIGFLCIVGICAFIHYCGKVAEYIIKMLELCSIVAMNTIALFTAPARLIRMNVYLKILAQIDAVLQSIPEKDIKKRPKYKFIFLFVGFFMLRLADLLISFLKADGSTMTALLRIISTYFLLNLFIGTLLQLQITFFVERVNKTLIAINNTLRILLTDDGNCGRGTRQRVRKNIGNEESMPHKIRELALHCRFINQIVSRTTKEDGTIMLLAMVYMTLNLELCLYPMFGTIVSRAILTTEEYMLHFLLTFWCICTFLFFIYYIEQFHRTHSEMQRTYNLIVSRKSAENEIEVENELELFFRTLILTSVKFSPLRMCTLDRPLMLKIFGCLMTYLVIILQYGLEVKNVTQYSNNATNYPN